MAAFTGSNKKGTKIIYRYTEYDYYLRRERIYYGLGTIENKTLFDGYLIKTSKGNIRGPIKLQDILQPESQTIRREKDYFIFTKMKLFQILGGELELTPNQSRFCYGESIFHCTDFLPTNKKIIQAYGADCDLEVKKKYFSIITNNAIDE